jgi:hypothetical protein
MNFRLFPRTFLYFTLFSIFLGLAAKLHAQEVVLTGTIGKKEVVWMRLTKDEKSDSVSGAYFYNSQATERRLTGKLTGEDYDLAELDSAGKPSAKFQLKNQNVDEYKGKIASAKGKPLPIALKKMGEHGEFCSFTEPPFFISKPMILWGTNKPYNISVFYPQFTDIDGNYARALFNSVIEVFAKAQVDSFVVVSYERRLEGVNFESPDELDIKYNISYFSPTFVSVEFNRSIKYTGALQTYEATVSKTFSVSSNKWLALGDLFRTGSPYLERLTGIFTKSIPGSEHIAKASFRGSADADEGKISDETFQNFTVTRDGLHIYFELYNRSTDSIGPWEILVRFAEIKDILDPNGELKEFLW